MTCVARVVAEQQAQQLHGPVRGMAHAVTSYPSASVYKAENLDAMSRGVAEQHAAWSNRHLEGRGVVCAITPCLGGSMT